MGMTFKHSRTRYVANNLRDTVISLGTHGTTAMMMLGYASVLRDGEIGEENQVRLAECAVHLFGDQFKPEFLKIFLDATLDHIAKDGLEVFLENGAGSIAPEYGLRALIVVAAALLSDERVDEEAPPEIFSLVASKLELQETTTRSVWQEAVEDLGRTPVMRFVAKLGEDERRMLGQMVLAASSTVMAADGESSIDESELAGKKLLASDKALGVDFFDKVLSPSLVGRTAAITPGKNGNLRMYPPQHKALLERMPAEARGVFDAYLMSLLIEVSEAGTGFLGLGKKIEESEKEAIRALVEGFGLRVDDRAIRKKLGLG